MTLSASAAGDVGLGPRGQGWVSSEPGAYSQARQQLPLTVYEQVNQQVCKLVQSQAGAARLWCRRLVDIVDGSSVSMPDEAELQAAFPQPSGQKPGCGFPVARLLAIFSWASGVLLKLAVDSLHVSELALLRRVRAALTPQSVALADRHFSSYHDIALLQAGGHDVVMRLHQRRPTDLRRGRRLGGGDHLVTWTRPTQPATGFSDTEWAALPATLTVRHVRAVVARRGFRSRRIEIMTTLLDPQAYPASELIDLYRQRWIIELNLRSLKTTMKMDVLRCKSVEMIRKELLMYQIAYNLIRWLMWQAAQRHNVETHRLSFAGTQQCIMSMLPYLTRCRDARQRRRLMKRLLEWIAANNVPHRPNRVEPRCVKRRPKNYQRLTCPRDEARTRCLRTPQAFQR